MRVFLKVHREFDMKEYSIQPNGNVIFNIKHSESGLNYFLNFDFSSNHILIKRLIFIIKCIKTSTRVLNFEKWKEKIT